MPGFNNNKISHSTCPINVQHITWQALSQYHKCHPLHLSHGYQIPNRKWSRNGSRKLAHSQGVLLSINETKTVENIYIDELDIRDEVSTRLAPSEGLKLIQLDDQLEHLVYIGSKLVKDIRSLLIHFLKHNTEVFA